jgi:predicted dehydrogenase
MVFKVRNCDSREFSASTPPYTKGMTQPEIERKIRISILGGSSSSAIGNAHRLALKSSGGNEIVGGVFSRDSMLNVVSNKWWDAVNPMPYSNFQEMKDRSDEFDLVVVMTPPEDHFKSILSFLEIDKKIISEKPLASCLNEVSKIKEEINNKTGYLRTTYNYSGYPMVRELKRRIDDKLFGKIFDIRIQMYQEGFIKLSPSGDPYKPQNWRLVDGDIPTVSLDLGTHVVHLLMYLLDSLPAEGYAITNSEGHFDVIDRVEFLGKTDLGITTNLGWGKTSLGYQNGLKVEIFGEKGSALWVQTNPETLQLADQRGELHLLSRGNPSCLIANEPRYTRFKGGHPSGFIEALTNVYDDFFYFENSNDQMRNYFDISASEQVFNCLDKIHKVWAT